MSLADADRAALRLAISGVRKRVELVAYHLDSTETVQDAIDALREAQRTCSQVVTDIQLIIERMQARLGS